MTSGSQQPGKRGPEKIAGKRTGNLPSEMHLENVGSGIPGLHDWTEQDQDVERESGRGSKLENTGIINGSPILLEFHQLLPTLHPRLLPGGQTTHGADQEGSRKGLVVEPRSGCSISRTAKTVHHGTSPSSL